LQSPDNTTIILPVQNQTTKILYTYVPEKGISFYINIKYFIFTCIKVLPTDNHALSLQCPRSTPTRLYIYHR
jgi:hypothetical protein